MTALAQNYDPLNVCVTSADGSWVTDTDGRRYLDMLAGYSALNFGHNHPQIIAAAKTQLDRVTLTSRAFSHDLIEPFADALTELTGTEMMLPMNTGAEAVESAVKIARRWGYHRKGVAPDRATIVVAANNFHGRTTTVVSMSTDPEAREGYGPYTPGFVVVPYNDVAAVAEALQDPSVVAVLVEPIQGEAGVLIPDDDYLRSLRTLTSDAGSLLILDEIQSGLGRTGSTLAQDLVGVKADLTTLGKALGGGVMPVSAVVGRRDVLDVLTPGSHGSTFGGNPLACAVALEVIDLLKPGTLQRRSRQLGEVFSARLNELRDEGLLAEVRTVGLWAGIDVAPHLEITGKQLSYRLADRGVLTKDTHGSTIRLAPPLNISEPDLEWGLGQISDALRA